VRYRFSMHSCQTASSLKASQSGHPSSILTSNYVRPSAGAFNMSFWHFAGGMLLIEPVADQPLVLQPP
jgi:hypothetical protein